LARHGIVIDEVRRKDIVQGARVCCADPVDNRVEPGRDRLVRREVRRALRRRLEETGYIFVATDRLAAARLAVAAARALDDPAIPPERHPLVRLLLGAGLARLLGSEKIGTRRAADLLLELIERATQQQNQSGPTETRPSGLILPR